ncbi:MAG TPA: prolyl aminopeptidase [Methylothermaceae bacterium]|nr:prolyl aminopeptidase [Methylothermaceae bacterium]
MKMLYPPIEPHARHWIEADGHRIYYEECGNPEGLPVLFLHGGPGSGCRPEHRRFFDPQRYRIILMDQRGSGRSEPQGEIRDNDTWKLLEDIEAIRLRLGVNRWLLFGGSWGGALALLYAQHHPERVLGMILRGVFLARRYDLDWFVRDGVRRIYPDHWHALVTSLPVSGWNDMIQGMYKAVTGGNEALQRRVVVAWSRWSDAVTLGRDFPPDRSYDPEALLPKVKIELHYAAHQYFLKDNQILEGCRKIRAIPCVLVHGRWDLVCPLEAAFTLHRHLPGAQLQVLEHSGHIARGEEMVDALVKAADRMAERLSS